MATKKALATKKTAPKKAAPKNTSESKTTVRTVSAAAPERVVRRDLAMEPESVANPGTTMSDLIPKREGMLPTNLINIVFAELFGTFILVLVAMLAFKESMALYLGLTLAVLSVMIGAVSGAHVNPAVTLGLAVTRKLRPLLIPFYWASQLLGAMLAVMVTNWVTGGKLNLDFGHFVGNNFNMFSWPIFTVEFVGTLVFLFGLMAVFSRRELGVVGKALGAGLSLMAGVLVASSLFATVQASIDTSKINDIKEVPHVLRVKGATLNPAVALATTEQTDANFTGQRGATTEKQYSRFTLEVLTGTLLGATVGALLYLVVAGVRQDD